MLQNLLQLTTKFKQLAEQNQVEESLLTTTKNSSSDNNNNNDNVLLSKSKPFDEEWIQLISSLITSTTEIEKTVKEKLSNSRFVPSLILLSDYISLPITAIFHIEINNYYYNNVFSGVSSSSLINNNKDYNATEENNKSKVYLDENKKSENSQIVTVFEDNNDDGDGVNNNETKTMMMMMNHSSQKWIIRRDYLYKLYISTSKLMKTYLETITTSNNTFSDNNNIPSATAATTPASNSVSVFLNKKYITNYLIAIANILPQQQQSNKQQQQLHQNPMNGNISSLNDGTDLWISLLETIQTILEVIISSRHQQQENDSSVSNGNNNTIFLLTQIWDGALVARIVDGVSFLLLPQPPPSPSQSREPNNVQINSFGNNATMMTKNNGNEYVQVQALRTLDQLLEVCMEEEESSSSSTIWRSIFPGIFVTIYKKLIKLHRQTSSGYSIDVECYGIEVLSKLFKHTMTTTTNTTSTTRILPSPSSKETTTTTFEEQEDPSIINAIPTMTMEKTKTSSKKKTSAVAILTQLQNRTAAASRQTTDPPSTSPQLASQDNSNIVHGHHNDTSHSQEVIPGTSSSSSFSFFQTQVHQKVIAPLSVLLRQCSASSSPRIRIQLLQFCRTLLIDTNNFWTMEEEKSSIESASSSTTTTKIDDSSGIGNSIPDLSMDLCLILESDQDEHVCTQARAILDDYRTHGLESNNKWMFDSSQTMFVSKILDKIEGLPTLAQGSKTIELRKELHLITGYLRAFGPSSSTSVALSSSIPLRRSLIATMDISLESTGSITAIDDKIPASVNLKFRYLNAETLPAANSFLQMLGRSLGYKHGSMIVDGVLADMFESIDATQLEVTREWTQRWIGSLVVANRILLGAFEIKVDDDIETKNKMKKRRLRILNALASSILPLLCESGLWNLSTKDISPFLPVEFAKPNFQLPPPRVLQANECMLVLMIELVSSFCTLLQDDGDKFWPALLISLSEKAHQLNSALVQNAAYQCLQKIAMNACEPSISDVSIFVTQGLSSLVSSMISQLRLPGGVHVLKIDEFDENVLRVSFSLRWVVEMLSKSLKIQNNEKSKQHDADFSLMDLIRTIVARVDRFHLNKRLSNESMMEFNFLYRSSLDYLLVYWGGRIEEVYTYPMEQHIEDSDQPWLDLLSAYRNAPIGFGSSDQISSYSEGCGDPSSGKQKDSMTADDTTGKKVISEREISFVSLIISRSCLLLSHHSLHVTIAACESLTAGFRFLAFVSTRYNDPKDESRKIQNSILQQVASSWPAIKARLVTVSDELNSPADLMLLLNIQNKSLNINSAVLEGDNDAPKRVFLAKLFTLIATLCECSGDFMANRFKTDVWKIAVRHLRPNLQGQERSNVNPRLEQGSPAGLTAASLKSNINASERLVVTSILSCIRRIFQQRDCSDALSVIMESVGTMLVPYLEYEDEAICSSASQTLKIIVSLDYDVLRRPLLILSGRGIPPIPKLKNLRQPSPLLTTNNKTESSITVKTHTAVLPNETSKISEESEELLQFADALPEQKVG